MAKNNVQSVTLEALDLAVRRPKKKPRFTNNPHYQSIFLPMPQCVNQIVDDQQLEHKHTKPVALAAPPTGGRFDVMSYFAVPVPEKRDPDTYSHRGYNSMVLFEVKLEELFGPQYPHHSRKTLWCRFKKSARGCYERIIKHLTEHEPQQKK